MSEHTYLQEEEMIRRAIHVLIEELGPVETTRFLTMSPRKRLDSVTRHRLWQEGLDREAFFDRVFAAESPDTTP